MKLKNKTRQTVFRTLRVLPLVLLWGFCFRFCVVIEIDLPYLYSNIFNVCFLSFIMTSPVRELSILLRVSTNWLLTLLSTLYIYFPFIFSAYFLFFSIYFVWAYLTFFQYLKKHIYSSIF